MIYLTRHGETDWNRKKIIQGWASSAPLNQTGRMQAHTIARYFDGKHLSYVVTSPIERAYQTARIIAHINKTKLFTDKNFKEIDYGNWSGKTGNEVKKLYPDEWKQFVSDPENFHFQKGEAIKKFYERTISGIEGINKEDDVLIVTHSNPIRMIIAYILNIPIRNIYGIHIENCTISGIRHKNNKWEVEFLNCRVK